MNKQPADLILHNGKTIGAPSQRPRRSGTEGFSLSEAIVR
jgi:hypothetical protein